MQELLNLYYEWLDNKEWWFSKNSQIDVYLCDKYYRYLCYACNIYEEYSKYGNYDNKVIIACIILLDQVTRHYKRVYDDSLDVIEYTRKAVGFSNILLYRNNFTIFSIDELSFIYLPYRHLKDIDKIYEIISNYILLYDKGVAEDKLKCRRYIHATLNNIYKDINALSMKNTIPVKRWEDINKDILDPMSCKNNLICSINDIVYSNMLDKIGNIDNDSTIVVSLSGGVDSMVALYTCKYIKDVNNSKKIKNIIEKHQKTNCIL